MAKRKDFQNFDMYLEFLTVEKMIHIYCHAHHHIEGNSLCEECSEVLDYARTRTLKCPHFRHKIPCSKCKIHCYQEPFRSKIVKIMRFAGPRMPLRHPLLSIRKIFCNLRKSRL
ncbi:MAG: hypothetical protein Kow0029_02160 [Candidatus Rifleibacteriota bacterium]